MKFKLSFFCCLLSIFPVLVLGQSIPQNRDVFIPASLKKPLVDDYWHYHDVGNLGMTITNYGLLGQGYNSALKEQPSCVYKYKSRLEKEQIEHFSYAGLWIGGIGGANGEQEPLVSTAIVDGVFEYGEAGYEFTNSASKADTIRERSSIVTSPNYDPAAISHQDFICDFTDQNTTVPGSEIELVDHTPLGVNVHLESYAWNYAYADAFVILNYTITNVSDYPIEKVYAGLWVDASIANMNYTNKYEPGGGFTWYDNLNGFDKEYNMAYQYDVDGDNGFAESYLGIRALGASVPLGEYAVHFDQWKWATPADADFPDYFMPVDDAQRYEKLSTTPPIDPPTDPELANSWMMLLSMGPLGDLMPGDSLNAVITIVCGLWDEGSNDSPARRKNLRLNSDWAMTAYNGEDVDGDGRLDLVDEDVNANGILDETEDLDADGHLDINEDVHQDLRRGIVEGNGKIDRYILPSPPPSPNMLLVPGDGEVAIYWDNIPELFEDPITREIDFEGYRIYSSPKTVGVTDEATKLAQFDVVDDMGYDTGFWTIRHDTTINDHDYHYRFVNDNLLNGWPGKYFYSVTSYDRGNPANNLPSMESSVYENLTYAIPGAAIEKTEPRKIYVYPNPYRALAAWDGSGERERLLWFANLPAKCNIRIYTLAGDLVDDFDHDAAVYTGSDSRRLSSITGVQKTILSGGEHGWDLISQNDQAIATGLYLFSVEDKDSGEIYQGKFLVIK